MHLVLNAADVDGIAWSRTGWLGLSLMQAATYDHTLLLLLPETCQAYALPGLCGTLQALSMLK